MSDKPQNEYLRSQIMTASPQQLQMMLYDGAIRFCEQARQALEAHDIPAIHDRLVRAQRIMLELSTNLKADLAPELCGKLAGLYTYVYRLLVDANFHKDLVKLDEALSLLRYQRDTWQLVLEKLRQEHAPPATEPATPAPAPSRAAHPSLAGSLLGGTLSLEG